MPPLRIAAACALALGFLAPAWAVHKCTGADGKVTFQDAPCAGGRGEEIDVRPAMQGATPIAPRASGAQEGAFGPTWQRKHFLQNQGVPQARAAVERQQKECAAQQQQPDAVAHAGPLRRSTLAGTQFAQEREASAGKERAACEAQVQELRDRLKSLQEELEGL